MVQDVCNLLSDIWDLLVLRECITSDCTICSEGCLNPSFRA